MTNHRTLIAPDAKVAEARAFAALLEEGVNMFPREATDGEASFFASAGQLSELTAQQLPYKSWAFDGESWTVTHDHPGDLEALAARMNATPEQAAQLQALLGIVDISDQPWEQAFERMGITLVPDEE